jgi:hypothetical protein
MVAQAIIELQLQRLTGMERWKIRTSWSKSSGEYLSWAR